MLTRFCTVTLDGVWTNDLHPPKKTTPRALYLKSVSLPFETAPFRWLYPLWLSFLCRFVVLPKSTPLQPPPAGNVNAWSSHQLIHVS